MRRVILEATDENVLNSIKENTYNRIEDIKDFVYALESIEGNMFISLDARWGEGKTFYVRQIEKTLEYLTKRTWGNEEIGETASEVENLRHYFKNTTLDSIILEQSYLPIYYNAWLYDNHDDPLMSLVLIIAKIAEGYLDTKMPTSFSEKIAALLSIPSLTVKDIQLGFDGSNLKKAIEGKDIFENIKTAEEIRNMVKEILNEVIVERAERLVVFIDELDRCKPSYAIEMLERIKPYFDDERIIFVVSVNKEQLIHTISKCYGSNFDSTGYLNKFFDLNVHMPVVSKNYISRTININQMYRQNHLNKIVDGLNDYYKLTIRDSILFRERVNILAPHVVNDYEAEGCCLSLFIPLIAILDIVDEKEKIKFLKGESNIIETISIEVPAIYTMICRFGDSEQDKYAVGLKKIQAVYDYAFKNKEKYEDLLLDVSYDFKALCMRLCNGFLK